MDLNIVGNILDNVCAQIQKIYNICVVVFIHFVEDLLYITF